jgi:hypothetical protein
MRAKRSVSSLTAILLVTLVPSVIYYQFFYEPLVYPIPAVADITSMRIYLYRKGFSEFIVPQTHWSTILDALRPARQEKHPPERLGLGKLTLLTRDGHTEEWHLSFQVGFSVSNDAPVGLENNGHHFRAGNARELERLIFDAQKAFSQ